MSETPPALEAGPVPVLLVDDQPFVVKALTHLVGDVPDIVLHCCLDPAAAIATAHDVQPFVILLDIVMPGIDGLTLCRSFRADSVTRDRPIVMLSGNDDAEVKAAAFGAGADDYLVKLPDKVELIARLRYHARAYLTRMERDAAYRSLRESQQQLEALNRELELLATLDGLTGLANRRFFNQRLREEWRRAARHQRPLSLIMLDVDHFKGFNDRHGHLAGDDCLQALARAFKSAARRVSDVVARYGGEEFALIMPETAAEGALRVAERVRLAVMALAIPHGASTAGPSVTVSLGVASTIPVQWTDPDALISAADRCLYAAKDQGRNRAVATVMAAGAGAPG